MSEAEILVSGPEEKEISMRGGGTLSLAVAAYRWSSRLKGDVERSAPWASTRYRRGQKAATRVDTVCSYDSERSLREIGSWSWRKLRITSAWISGLVYVESIVEPWNLLTSLHFATRYFSIKSTGFFRIVTWHDMWNNFVKSFFCY